MFTFEKKTLYSILLVGIVLLLAIAYFFNYWKKTPIISPPSKQTSERTQILPATVLDLETWKLTLPVSVPNDGLEPLQITQPELSNFRMPPWFDVSKDKSGVIFRAAVNAPTTDNTDYPRSELREMTNDGAKEMFWPSTSGIHTLFLQEAITAVPKNKPHVVAGQIHGDDDDLLVIRLENPKLYLTRSKKNLVTLDENYVLGKKFSIKFVATDGKISVYYNESRDPVYVLKKKVKQAYFKAGVYTQSNCETEESPDLCSDNNYGEVTIYDISVTHQ